MATQKKRDTSSEDAEPAEQPAEAAPAEEVSGPRPYRVEPFGFDEAWGWRLAAADGTVIHETDVKHSSPSDAVNDAKTDDRTVGATFPNRV